MFEARNYFPQTNVENFAYVAGEHDAFRFVFADYNVFAVVLFKPGDKQCEVAEIEIGEQVVNDLRSGCASVHYVFRKIDNPRNLHIEQRT